MGYGHHNDGDFCNADISTVCWILRGLEMMTEIVNGRILRTVLGEEDHGIFTASIIIDMGNTGCAFGGYALDTYDKLSEKRIGTAYGMQFIMGVLSVLGVPKWESLAGTYLRAEVDGTMIKRIGHIIDDNWFDPEKLGDEFR